MVGWGFIATLILICVLYRNKLQFSEWYKGKDREKLPKIVSQIFIFSSISLLLLITTSSQFLIQLTGLFSRTTGFLYNEAFSYGQSFNRVPILSVT